MDEVRGTDITQLRDNCSCFMGRNQSDTLPLTNRNIAGRLWASQTQVPWNLLPRPWPTACLHPSAFPLFPDMQPPTIP